MGTVRASCSLYTLCNNWSVWSSARTEHIDWQGAEPSSSQNKQRKSTKHPSSKRNPLINNNYIPVHSRSLHEDAFVGNPSFNTNLLPAWVVAYLSGPKVSMKLRSCNYPVRKTKRKQRAVTVAPNTCSKKKRFGNNRQRELPKQRPTACLIHITTGSPKHQQRPLGLLRTKTQRTVRRQTPLRVARRTYERKLNDKWPGLPWIWISMDISMCGY